MDKEKVMQAINAIRGAADEANTIAEYLNRLIDRGEATTEEAENEIEVYSEIISDELNHIIKFTELASELCGIEIAED